MPEGEEEFGVFSPNDECSFCPGKRHQRMSIRIPILAGYNVTLNGRPTYRSTGIIPAREAMDAISVPTIVTWESQYVNSPSFKANSHKFI